MKSALTKISFKAAAKLVDGFEKKYVNKPDFKDKGIEKKIRPVVIALVAHGFPTRHSCHGHPYANLYPEVGFAPRNGAKTKREVIEHLRQVQREVEQLTELLGEYWLNSPRTTPDRELQVTRDWEYMSKTDAELADIYLEIRAKKYIALPGYELKCAGANQLLTTPSEVLKPYRKKILRHRREDMLRFGKFLHSKL